MREITAKVLNNKSILLSNKNFGNKMDNSITKVIFTNIEDDANLLNKYVAFYSPSSNIFLFPLNSEDNSFIITSNLTTEAGLWSMIYLATNTAIVEGDIDSKYKSFVSNVVDFSIEDNFLDDTIEEPIIDENLTIIYEQLEQTIVYLNSDDFKEDLINNLHISESDIQLIINNLKNDEEFRAELKGEPGEAGADGKSAYEVWLDAGNTGTEEDFLNSLVGPKGDNGTFDTLTEEQKAELKGADGEPGADGTTFKPSIDAEGNLSWSNDGEKENPPTINIKGPKGEDGNFESLTDEQKAELKGESGEPGADGKSAYDIYKDDFEYSPLVNGNKLGGRQLKITDLDNLTPWEVNITDTNDRILYIYIKEDAKYIQDMTTLEIINFDDNLEALIPEEYEYFYSVGFEKFPDISIFTYKIGNLLSIKSIGDILSEDEWIDSLKGEDYVLTEEDKTEIAEKVEGSFIISGAIERIEIVDDLPETEETGVLYLVKG